MVLVGAHHTEEAKKKISGSQKNHIPWNKKPKVKLICSQCGKIFEVIPSIADIRKHCSKKCHIKSQELEKGEKNHAYGIKRLDLIEYNKNHIRQGEDNPNFGNHALKGRPFTQEHKNKIQVAQLANGKKPSFKERMRRQRMTQVLPTKNTSIEVKLQNGLKQRNIEFIPHYKFNGKFELDIAFPSKQIAVEADGVYYHNYPHGLPNDKKKDKYLIKCGWQVLRFWEHEINSNLKGCINKIMTAMETR